MPFGVFISFGGPPRAMEHSLPVAARKSYFGDAIRSPKAARAQFVAACQQASGQVMKHFPGGFDLLFRALTLAHPVS